MGYTSETTSAWLRRFRPTEAAPARLVCFPHAGGSASAFFAYSKDLSDLDILAVQYPGRQDRIREPHASSAEELADQVASVLLPLLDRPTALLGHSMGAIVAFEVARRLEAASRAPLALFVSGRRAPSINRSDAQQGLSDAELLDVVRGLRGPGAELLADADLAVLFLPVIRADYRIVETYRQDSLDRLNCPLVVLNGIDDELVTTADAEAWAEHTVAGTQLHWYPGGHFYLLDDPQPVLRTVAGTIDRLLAPGAAGARRSDI